MINMNFNLRLPFDKFKILFVSEKVIPFCVNKCYCFQINHTDDIIGFGFAWRTRMSHSGVDFNICFLGIDVSFQIYDRRHWDDEKGEYLPFGHPLD